MSDGVLLPDDAPVFISSIIVYVCFHERLKILVVRAVDIWAVLAFVSLWRMLEKN